MNKTKLEKAMEKKNVEDLLLDASKLFGEKAIEYGDSYKRAGDIYSAFFPNGIELKTKEDFARYNTFSLCVMKLNRYAENLTKGGHLDSARDLSVYAAILEWRTETEEKSEWKECPFYIKTDNTLYGCNHVDNKSGSHGGLRMCFEDHCPNKQKINWEI